MSEENNVTAEFEGDEPRPEKVGTDINPQEINENPEQYARKVAIEQGNKYDQMAGFSVPREYVTIPSRGKIYPPTSALHNMEEIEVRHLTAADEDVLTSRSLLRSGKAIDTMLSNVILNKSIKVEDLISGDKNAILTFLRITGYGAEYPVEIDCPSCNENVKYEFDLGQLKMRILDTEPLGVGENRFSFELPSGVSLEFKLLNSAEDSEISDMQEKHRRATNSPLERNITTKMKYQIVSVNGDNNKTLIGRFVDSMNVRDSRAFRKHLEDTEPDMDMSQDFKCPMCGHSGEVDIPITVGFFWPES